MSPLHAEPWVSSTCRLVTAAVVAAGLSIAASSAQEQSTLSPRAESGSTVDATAVEIPRPDLSSMNPAARQRVRSVQEGLGTLLARPEGAPRPEVGQALGFLGQIYQALDLPEAAEKAYAQARDLVPRDPRWTYYLGLLYNGRGELEAALAEYDRFATARPELALVPLRRGEALLNLGRLEEAAEAFRRAQELAPEEMGAAALYGLGRVAAEAGDDRAAVERLTRTLERQPGATVVHYPLAQAYRRLGNTERATYHLALQGDREVAFPDPLGGVLEGIAKSVALDVVAEMAAAEDFDEVEYLGFVAAQFGDSASAATTPMRQLLESRESEVGGVTFGRLHVALGLVLSRAGEDEAAVEAFSRGIELDPSLVESRLQLGSALARLGRFTEALEHFDQVLARVPDSVAARVQRGAVRANLGQLDEAQTDLRAAVDADPGDAEAWLRLGHVLLRSEETEEGLEALRRAATAPGVAPGVKAEALTAMGEQARAGGDLETAAGHFAAALDVAPHHRPALAAQAGLRGQLGQYGRSATLYRRLVELEPDNRVARMGEVTALVLAGEDAAARSRLEAALARNPEDLAFLDVLARHLAAASDEEARDGARAVELAEELYAKVPTPESMETLAMAHAEAGDFDNAVEWQQRLLETLGDDVEPANAARLEANLRRYRNRQSCCASPPRAVADEGTANESGGF